MRGEMRFVVSLVTAGALLPACAQPRKAERKQVRRVRPPKLAVKELPRLGEAEGRAVLAEVAGQKITVADLYAHIRRMSPIARRGLSSIEARKRYLMARLVRPRLKLAEARRRGILQSKEARTFRRGLLIKQMQEELEHQIRIPAPTRQEIADYVGSHPDEFRRPETVVFAVIRLRSKLDATSVSARLQTMSRKEIEAWVRRRGLVEQGSLRSGVVRPTDRHGVFYRGLDAAPSYLPRAMIQAAWALRRPMSFSEPIHARGSWFLVCLLEHKEPLEVAGSVASRLAAKRISERRRALAMKEKVNELRKTIPVVLSSEMESRLLAFADYVSKELERRSLQGGEADREGSHRGSPAVDMDPGEQGIQIPASLASQEIARVGKASVTLAMAVGDLSRVPAGRLARAITPAGRKELVEQTIRSELLHQEALRRGYHRRHQVRLAMERYVLDRLDAILANELVPASSVTKEMIREAYDKQKQRFVRPERVGLWVIRAGSRQETDRILTKVHQAPAAERPRFFGKLAAERAKKTGAGGKRPTFGGYFSRDTKLLPAPLVKAAFSARKLGLVGPIRVKRTWYLAWVLRRVPPRHLSWDDPFVLGTLGADLLDRLQKRAVEQYWRKPEAKADIVIHSDRLARVPTGAESRSK